MPNVPHNNEFVQIIRYENEWSWKPEARSWNKSGFRHYGLWYNKLEENVTRKLDGGRWERKQERLSSTSWKLKVVMVETVLPDKNFGNPHCRWKMCFAKNCLFQCFLTWILFCSYELFTVLKVKWPQFFPPLFLIFKFFLQIHFSFRTNAPVAAINVHHFRVPHQAPSLLTYFLV